MKPELNIPTIPVTALSLRMRFNPGMTAHIFHTDFKMSRDELDSYINLSRSDSKVRENLIQSQVRF
jgi:hypothetical protein